MIGVWSFVQHFTRNSDMLCRRYLERNQHYHILNGSNPASLNIKDANLHDRAAWLNMRVNNWNKDERAQAA